MKRLCIGDEVKVLAGKDRGKIGTIMRFNGSKRSYVLVQGVNMNKKAVKPTQEDPNGGIFDKENFLHISNVALMSPKLKKPSRIKIEVKDGKRVRVLKKCNSEVKNNKVKRK